MFKDKLTKVKESLKNKEDGGNNKKIIENLVVFVIILIVTIVVINYVWNGDKNNSKQMNNTTTKSKVLASTDNEEKSNSQSENSDETERKLEDILSNIKGVGNVKVMITYSQTSKVEPMYSEDSSQKITQENDSGGGTRTVNENTTKKDLAYQENNGVKTIVTQSTMNPIIEGAIIAAQGVSNAEIKSNIIQAVEAATGLATHKIQVFEMN